MRPFIAAVFAKCASNCAEVKLDALALAAATKAKRRMQQLPSEFANFGPVKHAEWFCSQATGELIADPVALAERLRTDGMVLSASSGNKSLPAGSERIAYDDVCLANVP